MVTPYSELFYQLRSNQFYCFLSQLWNLQGSACFRKDNLVHYRLCNYCVGPLLYIMFLILYYCLIFILGCRCIGSIFRMLPKLQIRIKLVNLYSFLRVQLILSVTADKNLADLIVHDQKIYWFWQLVTIYYNLKYPISNQMYVYLSLSCNYLFLVLSLHLSTYPILILICFIIAKVFVVSYVV